MLEFRNADRIEAGLHRCRSVLVSDETQERRDRRITKLIVDRGGNVEELPNLSRLEADLKDTLVPAVRKRYDFGIKNRYARRLDRVNEVRTILDLLFAVFAKDHEREKPRSEIYRTFVR